MTDETSSPKASASLPPPRPPVLPMFLSTTYPPVNSMTLASSLKRKLFICGGASTVMLVTLNGKSPFWLCLPTARLKNQQRFGSTGSTRKP
eukprot:scaffold5189_cov275-Pinguiococcus_pyrenoidosus.AAC.4